MIPENFATLIQKLKEKTLNRQAIWSKTSREDEFKLDLGQGAITVDHWQDPEDGEIYVDIAVINDRGDRIDSILYSMQEPADFKNLEELHRLAKRAYYKVDETFKTIFKELDSDKTIGIEKGTKDLPFG